MIARANGLLTDVGQCRSCQMPEGFRTLYSITGNFLILFAYLDRRFEYVGREWMLDAVLEEKRP